MGRRRRKPDDLGVRAELAGARTCGARVRGITGYLTLRAALPAVPGARIRARLSLATRDQAPSARRRSPDEQCKPYRCRRCRKHASRGPGAGWAARLVRDFETDHRPDVGHLRPRLTPSLEERSFTSSRARRADSFGAAHRHHPLPGPELPGLCRLGVGGRSRQPIG